MIALLLLGILPDRLGDPVEEAAVAVIEINHVYSDSNPPAKVFSQFIFWERQPWGTSSHLRCCGFVVLGKPKRWRIEGDSVTWRENGRWRRVRAGTVVRTWTSTDPEMDDRKKYPVKDREKLFEVDLTCHGDRR